MRRGVDQRKARLQRGGNFGGVIDGQGGLGDEGQTGRITNHKARHIGDGFHQQHLTHRQLPHGANGFRMTFMADVDHLHARLMVPGRLVMHFGDQRAGGIDGDHVAQCRLSRDGFWHAVGGKDHRAVERAIGQLLDKHRTFRAQAIDDELVVDNLVAHENRRTPFVQGHFHDLYSAVDPGTEPARGRKVQRQGGQVCHRRPIERLDQR